MLVETQFIGEFSILSHKWESVRELIKRLNLAYLYYHRKLCFLHSMMCRVNSVLTSVVRVYIHSLEYSKLCNFACVSPYDSKSKIKRCLTAKFAASIVS